ncbi:hypothetical protein SAMN05443543_1168 [Flavobacterium flevense]|nr:hypothetical protein SAMN05443543_1168 [Flavobacterium flevense]
MKKFHESVSGFQGLVLDLFDNYFLAEFSFIGFN